MECVIFNPIQPTPCPACVGSLAARQSTPSGGWMNQTTRRANGMSFTPIGAGVKSMSGQKYRQNGNKHNQQTINLLPVCFQGRNFWCFFFFCEVSFFLMIFQLPGRFLEKEVTAIDIVASIPISGYQPENSGGKNWR